MSEPLPDGDPLGVEMRVQLERTLRAFIRLVAKLEEIESSEEFRAVFVLFHLHGMRYQGPNWESELAEAREALAQAKALALRAEAADLEIPGPPVSPGSGG